MRMSGRKAFEPFKQPPGRESAHDADVQGVLEAPFGEAIERRADPVEGFRKYRDKALSVIRQGQPAWQPVEQPRAKPTFKLGDLMAHRTLADA